VKPQTWSIGCLVLVAALAALYHWAPALHHAGNSEGQPGHLPARVTAVTNTDVVRSRLEKPAPVASPLMDYKSSFAESLNYWNFAHYALSAANAGNADAQFYLSKALDYCAQHNSLYFQRKGKPINLDEGLQYAVQRHLPIDIAQAVYDRCHEFVDHDGSELGSAAEWLARATSAGQPLAQTVTASKILMQELQQDFTKAGGVANPNSETSIVNGDDPRELLRTAVQSKDPEVLFSIGEAQPLLDPTNTDKNTNRFAWMLVACQRGFDCSANAEWVKNSCANDPRCASANSPSDLVRTLAGDKWPEVEQRAHDLSVNLDQGQWSALGLGPS
jgi:hypothetical protein